MAVSTLDLERSLLFPLSTGRASASFLPAVAAAPPPSANGSAWPRPRGARRRPMGAAADAAFMRGSCGEGEREGGGEREGTRDWSCNTRSKPKAMEEKGANSTSERGRLWIS